jgi:hypothetical protein
LAVLKTSDTDRVELVNQTIVEEALQDLGELDFGHGNTAEANIAIWRECGTHRPMCGEYAFEVKFNRRDELHGKGMDRARQFFIELQQSGRDWLSSARPRPGSSTASKAIRRRRMGEKAFLPSLPGVCPGSKRRKGPGSAPAAGRGRPRGLAAFLVREYDA